jgi:hypothetical protein
VGPTLSLPISYLRILANKRANQRGHVICFNPDRRITRMVRIGQTPNFCKKTPHLPRNQLVVQSSRRGGPKSDRYCRQLPTHGPYNSSLLLIKNKHIWRFLLPSRRITMTSKHCELSRFIYKSMAPRSTSPDGGGAAMARGRPPASWPSIKLLRRGWAQQTVAPGAARCDKPMACDPSPSGFGNDAREAPPTHSVELPQHNATVARDGPRRR